MKKRICVFAALLCAVLLALPALAGGSYVVDEAGLLGGDTASLESQAADLAGQYGVGVYFVTVNDMGGMAVRDYAKQYYQQNALGEGSDQSGILFLVCMGTRDYVTVTYGGGVHAFTDYRIAQIEESVKPKLSDGDYTGAAETYMSLCGDTLQYMAENGEPLDSNNDPGSAGGRTAVKVLITVLAPCLIAGAVCAVFYAQMKTAKEQREAGSYVPENGFTLSRRTDMFTHTTETRQYDPPQQRDSGGGSMTDSSGFGGSSGGKF